MTQARRPEMPPKRDQPGLIDYWPPWEKDDYIFSKTAKDLVDKRLRACPRCREDRSCESHPEARDPEARRTLEWIICTEFLCGELDCPACREGSTCGLHWRAEIQDQLRDVFLVVGQVLLTTECTIFPYQDGYGLRKNRRWVLVSRHRIAYVKDPDDVDAYAVWLRELAYERVNMVRWLECTGEAPALPCAWG